jgi:hypothetical protein
MQSMREEMKRLRKLEFERIDELMGCFKPK